MINQRERYPAEGKSRKMRRTVRLRDRPRSNATNAGQPLAVNLLHLASQPLLLLWAFTQLSAYNVTLLATASQPEIVPRWQQTKRSWSTMELSPNAAAHGSLSSYESDQNQSPRRRTHMRNLSNKSNGVSNQGYKLNAPTEPLAMSVVTRKSTACPACKKHKVRRSEDFRHSC